MLQDIDLQYVNGVPTFLGPAAAAVLATTGQPATGGPPLSGTWTAGQFVTDAFGTIWICTASGTPGTWVPEPRDLGELLIAPAGATGETCQRSIATATSGTPASGTVYVRSIGLRSGIAINNITLFTAAGTIATPADITHGWYALLDSSLHVLAVSTDQVAANFLNVINTAYPLAVKAAAGATYTTTYTGLYYIAESLSISAASMPQFAASGGPSVGVGSASPPPNGTAGAQAAPPAIGAQLASGTVTFANTNVFYAYTS